MEFPSLLWRVIFSHEVLVLNDIGMDQVLGNAEFSIHLLKAMICHLLIVINFPSFVHEFALELLDLDLEDLSLGPRTQLLLHGYVKVVKWLL
jgi:hypothetical protein